MSKDIVLGSRVPNVNFGVLDGGQVRFVAARDVFEHRRAIVLGVPGAFTPGCSGMHVPDFIRSATRLRASGFDALICIAPNDPFVLGAWASLLDPEQKLLFLSDGNLDFATALGMVSHNRLPFLGKRCERYLLTVDDGIITRLRSETEGMQSGLPDAAQPAADVAFI